MTDNRPQLHPATIARRAVLAAGLGAGLARTAPRPANAAPTRVSLGYTATGGFLGAFVGKEHGLFAAQGLDLSLTLIALNATIPAALVGGSVSIGGPTPTVLLQANDNGLDLVVVAGCNSTDYTDKNNGILARTGSNIRTAADLVGKRVGVPGLNAFVHVLVRKSLADQGVDWRRVQFIEVPFSQMNDLLRAGQVDAVATGDPIYSRIVAQNTGSYVTSFLEGTPRGLPGLVYACTRTWAEAHRPEIARFRAVLADAAKFVQDRPDEARAIMTKYINLPPDLAASVVLPQLQADITRDQMRFWIEVMTAQDMLQAKPDLSALVLE